MEPARYEARHDQLTDLLNRKGLEEEFDRLSALIPGQFSAVCIDIDELKGVNDAYGHLAGDDLIADAANALKQLPLRSGRGEMPPDVAAAARIGGDEFVLLLAGTTKPEQIQGAISRIRNKLEDVDVKASIGGSPHQEDDNFVTLMQRADDATYADKNERKRAKFDKLTRRKKIAARIGAKLLNYSGIKPPR